MIPRRSKPSWLTRSTIRPICLLPMTATSEGARALPQTASIPNWRRSGKRTMREEALGIQRKKRSPVSFRRSLVEEERNIAGMAIITKRARPEHFLPIPRCAYSGRTLTIPGPDFPSLRSVLSTAWRTSSWLTPGGHCIPKYCSATLCIRTWPRCSKCIRIWCWRRRQLRDTNEPESSNRRNTCSTSDIKR